RVRQRFEHHVGQKLGQERWMRNAGWRNRYRCYQRIVRAKKCNHRLQVVVRHVWELRHPRRHILPSPIDAGTQKKGDLAIGPVTDRMDTILRDVLGVRASELRGHINDPFAGEPAGRRIHVTCGTQERHVLSPVLDLLGRHIHLESYMPWRIGWDTGDRHVSGDASDDDGNGKDGVTDELHGFLHVGASYRYTS